ncbi:MAG TPA: sulfite exporter TauE/SafE family protein [Candidatus Acidoferrales bacterium]|nr:sulfite exporter TauE/SafE family protein [Candidatus Acidoferrales bacterium]
MAESRARMLGILLTASVVGVFSGLFGVGGGVLLVPLLVLVHHFEQHRAQGTSLIALVPPTGLLAFLAYYRAGAVDVPTGLLIIPGVFLGGILGSRVAVRIPAARMRRIFAVVLFILGTWEFLTPVVHWVQHTPH